MHECMQMYVVTLKGYTSMSLIESHILSDFLTVRGGNSTIEQGELALQFFEQTDF